MDWTYAIKRNRDALKRVLAALVAMAGLGGGDAEFPSPLWGGVRGGGGDCSSTPTRPSDDGRPPHKGEAGPECRPTLPRHLHRAVLRLLRPAEAAARRLVIMAARGLVVEPPRSHARKPKPMQPVQRGGMVTGIWMPPHLARQVHRLLSDGRRASGSRREPTLRALPLFDPLPRTGSPRRRPSGNPRIRLPGWSAPHPAPPARPSKGRPLGPDDELDAARLVLRLAALGRALDDLPGHARRFARWQMRQARDRVAAGARNPGRACRVWPLKPGRPPGLNARSGHAVHDILQDAHSLAAQALEAPDTS